MTHTLLRRANRILAILMGVILLSVWMPEAVLAESSWSPTLLVNTESFQQIDSGDGTTDIELRFGSSTQTLKFLTGGKFQFSRGVSVQGALSGSSLRIDNNADIWGTLGVSGATVLKSTLTVNSNAKVRGTLSGNTLRVDGATSLGGAVNASGAVITNGALTINSDNDTNDATLTFGNSTAAQTLKFLNTQQEFEFTKGLRVNGAISGSGQLSVQNNINTRADILLNGDRGAADATITFGNATTNQTVKYNNTLQKFDISKDSRVIGNLSGSSLQIDGNSVLYGNLTTSGSVSTKQNLTINSDADTNDAVLTFGNNSGNKSLTFSNARQRFEFNSGIKTSGNLSGSTLTVDGNVTIKGQTYTFPTNTASAGQFLQNNGANSLTWASPTAGNSSGEILSLHPQYRNAVYTSSGTTAVGQMTMSGALGFDNFYRWTTSRGTLQDYWIGVRVQIPKNFTHFETASGILVRLRTATTNAADNYVTVRLLDTANAPVAVGNNAQLKSTTASAWRTNSITNVAGGTYTPLGYITLLIKMAATSAGATDLGFINFNWSNTTP